MSHVERAISNVVSALEESQSALRLVSSRLEFEFERVYCSARGSASSSVNPARLAARLAALDAAVPAAADAVLALAHHNLDAARAAKSAVYDTRQQTIVLRQCCNLDNYVPESAAACDFTDKHYQHSVAVQNLERLCARLTSLVTESQKSHCALVATQTSSSANIMSDDDLDMALLKAGLSSPSTELDVSMLENPHNLPAMSPTRPGKSPCLKKRQACQESMTHDKLGSDNMNKENKPRVKQQSNNGGSGGNGAQPARNLAGNLVTAVLEDEDHFVPITKAAYQRLPRMLKQQAKLEHLNDVYRKVYHVLMTTNRPMAEAELQAAIGDDAMQKIDVLRRGFSVVKQTSIGWVLTANASHGPSKSRY